MTILNPKSYSKQSNQHMSVSHQSWNVSWNTQYNMSALLPLSPREDKARVEILGKV
jgi:hypothetical protein